MTEQASSSENLWSQKSKDGVWVPVELRTLFQRVDSHVILSAQLSALCVLLQMVQIRCQWHGDEAIVVVPAEQINRVDIGFSHHEWSVCHDLYAMISADLHGLFFNVARV